jgi:hypothetical protein
MAVLFPNYVGDPRTQLLPHPYFTRNGLERRKFLTLGTVFEP